MRRLIIHIGRHKTGTSALQFYLAKNAQFLAENGIIYPESGRNGKIAHHQLHHALNQLDYDLIEEIFSNIKEESLGYERTIISSEGFQNLKVLSPLTSLSTHYDETVVICYLRETLSYLVSSYKQKVQAQDFHITLAEYISKTKLRYHEMVDRWTLLSDRMIHRLYESERLIGRNIITDFFDAVLDIQNPPKTEIQRNPSISGNLLLYKLLRNKLQLSVPKDYLRLQKIAMSMPSNQKEVRLDEKMQRDYRKGNKNNEYLESLFGPIAYKDYSSNQQWKVDDDVIQDFKLYNEYFDNKLPLEGIEELAKPYLKD